MKTYTIISPIKVAGTLLRSGTVDLAKSTGDSLVESGFLAEPATDAEPALHQDGPTVEEFVAAGYRAKHYPPMGYASRSSEEEIAAAITAQEEPAATHDQPESSASEAGAATADAAPAEGQSAAPGNTNNPESDLKQEVPGEAPAIVPAPPKAAKTESKKKGK